MSVSGRVPADRTATADIIIFEPQINGVSNLSKSQKESLRIDASGLARRRPGPRDINAAKKDSSAPPLSALLTARNIDRLDEVGYPEGIRGPKTELNQNAKDGKFRYDRDFLLQFMAVCKEKPPNLPPLDILGIEPVDQSAFGLSSGGSGRHRQPSAPMSATGVRSASIGLGISPFKPGPPPGPFAMGQFGTPGPKLTSEERFLLSQGSPSASVGTGPAAASLLSRPAGPALKSVKASANRWVPASIQRRGAADGDTPDVVDRKVKSLLNKLTTENFDSISDQIIAWANKSKNENDGRTLIQVVRLVFENVTDEANWSEVYARLCRKMMDTISPKVQDNGIKNAEGRPITGGQLFRKYLFSRCQEDFERGWVAKEATARAAAAKASDDEAVKVANEGGFHPEEYYAAQKAKRQGLGLIKFIGELFKLQMLTERIMHECVKKLLGNVENPEEEEIESLCQLMRTAGELLDVPKARAHMDVYFQRMRDLCKSPNVSPRVQFVLQDVIELRDQKWQPRGVFYAPTTLAVVHGVAGRESAARESQAFHPEFKPAPDGWAVAGSSQPKRSSKAGDLSHFGKTSTASPIVMGPSSVFAGKKDNMHEALKRSSLELKKLRLLLQNDPTPSRTPPPT